MNDDVFKYNNYYFNGRSILVIGHSYKYWLSLIYANCSSCYCVIPSSAFTFCN